MRADNDLCLLRSFLAGESGKRVGDVSQHVEEIALLGVDDLLHLGQLLAAKSFLGKTLQEFLPCIRRAPDGAEFGLVLEKLRQLAEEQFHELLR